MVLGMKAQFKATVLVVDDDRDDCEMLDKAFRTIDYPTELQFVHNGEELLDYVRGQGRFVDRAHFPLPSLILLDLNMPRLDGHEALKILKTDPSFRPIPILILSGAEWPEDVLKSYELGANSFIRKPNSYESWVQAIQSLVRYWFVLNELPARRSLINRSFHS